MFAEPWTGIRSIDLHQKCKSTFKRANVVLHEKCNSTVVRR